MSKYKTYDPALDPLALTSKDVTRLDMDASTQALYAADHTLHIHSNRISIDLDSASVITLTYNNNTYVLDKDRLFMFLTTMFMKED